MAKRLFFVSAAILMLMVAYHLGTREAEAQSSGAINGLTATAWGQVPGDAGTMYIVTPNGDCFSRRIDGSNNLNGSVYYMGNFWGGGTINVQPETWGGVKEKYR